MVEHVFTTQTPASTDVFDNSPITLATTILFGVDGTVSGGGFFAPLTPRGTYQLVLWQATAEDVPIGNGAGTVLATATFGSITPGAWNFISFSGSVPVTSNTVYKIGIRTSLGSYTATSGFFAGSSLVNGNVTALQNGSFSGSYNPPGSFDNGTFFSDLTSYPNHTFNATSYFVDVSFTAGSAPVGATPNGLAIPVSLGQPAATLVGATPAGLAIPVAVGQPAAALGRVATPNGLAIPVAVGQPSGLAPVATTSPNWPEVTTTRSAPIVATSTNQAEVAR